MSFQAVTWAIEQEVDSPSARCVLVSIANYANTEWCAWPKQETIARESVQSVDSVQRRMPALIAAKLVRRVKLKRFGRRTHDFYILPRSPYFEAELDEIRPLLPASCDVIEESEHVTADCGSAAEESPAESEISATAECGDATLPQSAPHATATVRQQEYTINLKESPPTPLRGDWPHEKSWKKFKEAWGEPIPHDRLCRDIWGKFTDLERADAVLVAAGYVRWRLGQRRPPPMFNAQKLLREQGAWPEYIALAGGAVSAVKVTLYDPKSQEARALRMLGRMWRHEPLVVSDGRISYLGKINDRLLAMANCPQDWLTFKKGTDNYAAWRDFAAEIFPGKLAALPAIDVPWTFPPRNDGSTGPPSNRVPGTLCTEEELQHGI
jgi:hypothetical protein